MSSGRSRQPAELAQLRVLPRIHLRNCLETHPGTGDPFLGDRHAVFGGQRPAVLWITPCV